MTVAVIVTNSAIANATGVGTWSDAVAKARIMVNNMTLAEKVGSAAVFSPIIVLMY